MKSILAVVVILALCSGCVATQAASKTVGALTGSGMDNNVKVAIEGENISVTTNNDGSINYDVEKATKFVIRDTEKSFGRIFYNWFYSRQRNNN